MIYGADLRHLLSLNPVQVGEPSVIKQGNPKTGGVILLGDFLNSPTAKSIWIGGVFIQGKKSQ